MKSRLLLAFVPLLLGGCANNVVLSPNPYMLRAEDPSTISVELLSNSTRPAVAQTVALETEAAAPFAGGLKTTITTAAGLGSAVVTATPVDHDTTVTISGDWKGHLWNPSGSTTVMVLPPIMESPKVGDDYVTVTPSVTPSWTYRYEIIAHNSAGHSPPNLTDCNLQFGTKVSLRVVSATNPVVPGMTVTATETPGGSWDISGGATFQTLVVEVRVADGKPGGLATITCRERTSSGWNAYVATPTGPRP